MTRVNEKTSGLIVMPYECHLRSAQLLPMMTLVDDRQQIRIFVSASAKTLIAELAAKTDMSEQGLASRIYQWFAQADPEVRRAVLGNAMGEDEVAKARRKFQALNGPVAGGVNGVTGNDPPGTTRDAAGRITSRDDAKSGRTVRRDKPKGRRDTVRGAMTGGPVIEAKVDG